MANNQTRLPRPLWARVLDYLYGVLGINSYPLKSHIDTFSGKSLYHLDADGFTIEVREKKGMRWMHFGSRAIQSAMLVEQPHILMLQYPPLMMSALLFNSSPQKALLFGLGGGSLARFLHYHFQDINLKVVEKSADVIKACHKYFMLPTDNRFSVEMDDAGRYLERSADGGFDLIMVDLFDSTTMPTCMRTVDLYNRCRQILSDQGVLSINLLVKDEQEFVLILKLIRDAFDGRTLCLTVAGRMNVIVLAFKNQPEDICFDDIEAKAERLEDMYKLDFVSYVHNIFDTNPTNDDGQLLL